MEPIRNKKASFKFGIKETFEAGIVLEGWEVKPILSRRVSLDNTYVVVKDGELYLLNMQVIPADHTSQKSLLTPVSATRTRKLLMKKKEIMKLMGQVIQDGYTLVPTKIYTNHGKIKVEIALAKGKNEFDKRQTIKNRESDRELARMMKKKG